MAAIPIRFSRQWQCLQEECEVLAQGYSDTMVLLLRPTTAAEFRTDQTDRVASDFKPQGLRRKTTINQQKPPKRCIHNAHRQRVNTDSPDF